jgi:23S rRNA pseudouridine1911/1915/1917 synthase
MKLFDIIYEGPDLLVINKAAGLVCHPTKGDVYSSLISRVRLHLGENSAPHLVNRLDRETSGIILIAKNVHTAWELRSLWENRTVEKEYLAIVHGHLSEPSGRINAPIRKDTASRVIIKECVHPDGIPAQTEFQLEHCFVKNDQPFSLLRVLPLTGRKHQIRIHLQHLGFPIVGDKLYGGDETLYLDLVEGRLTEAQWNRLILPHQALHARQVRFTWRDQDHVYSAHPEPWFTDFAATP